MVSLTAITGFPCFFRQGTKRSLVLDVNSSSERKPKEESKVNMENRSKKGAPPKPGCRCRQCAACMDEARWERIFREKFADPLYYGSQSGRASSPLVDL